MERSELSLEDIPFDVLAYMFSFLEPYELLCLILCSKASIVSETAKHDRVWKSHYENEVILDELGSEEVNRLENAKGYFEKYRMRQNFFVFVFRRSLGCYINPDYLSHLQDESVLDGIYSKTPDGIKVVFVGSPHVGKTSMIIKASNPTYEISEYVPTVFDEYVFKFQRKGKEMSLDFFDTAGYEDYDRIRPLSYPQVDVFVLCFAVCDRTSLQNLESKYLVEIKEHEPKIRSIVLRGLKCDTRKKWDEDEATKELKRYTDPYGKRKRALGLEKERMEREGVISKMEILRFAKKIDAVMYCETSAYDMTFLDVRDGKSLHFAICSAYVIGKNLEMKNSKQSTRSGKNDNKCCIQ